MGNEFVCRSLSNRAGGADHLPSHSAEVKNLWGFPSRPPITSRGDWDNLTFTQQLLPINQTYGDSSHLKYITQKHHQISLDYKIKKKFEMSWDLGTYGGKRGACNFLVGKHDGKRPLDRPRRRMGDNTIQFSRKQVVEAWTGLIWLRIGTSGWLLWTSLRTFGFHKMRVIS